MFQLRTFAALFLLAGSLGAAPGGCGPEPEPSRRGASTQKAEKPSKPQDPEQPIDPINLHPPVGPNDPVDPIEPTDPVNPVDPVDPADPIEPVDPVDPVVPTDPIEPVDPVDPIEPVDPVALPTHGTVDQKLVGTWIQRQERKYYDEGGSSVSITTRMRLELRADGSYAFNSSTGTWSVAATSAADWQLWQIDDYGSSRKMQFSKPDGFVATGPIDEAEGRVASVWMIYRDENGIPGFVWIQFDRYDPNQEVGGDEPVAPQDDLDCGGNLGVDMLGEYLSQYDRKYVGDERVEDYVGNGLNRLQLKADGSWTFAGTGLTGCFSVQPIEEGDFAAWGSTFDASQKIVLHGFEGRTISGPIENDSDRSAWLIYADTHGTPGTVWLQLVRWTTAERAGRPPEGTAAAKGVWGTDAAERTNHNIEQREGGTFFLGRGARVQPPGRGRPGVVPSPTSRRNPGIYG